MTAPIQSMPSRSPFRADRFFYVMGQGWYVETRWRPTGPFPRREIAEEFLERLKQRVNGRRRDVWS